MLLWCFLTNSVEGHDNIQIINNLIPVEFTPKIAGPLHQERISGCRHWLLEAFDELVSGYLGVSKDLGEKAAANFFTGVHRDHGSSPVRMAKVVMTAPRAHVLEAEPSK